MSGLSIDSTAVFDYPNAAALARHLLELSSGESASKVAVRAQASAEPIAIVGMACRFPGGVTRPAELWQLLERGGDGIGAFPDRSRLGPGAPLSIPTPIGRHDATRREGGFLAGAGRLRSPSSSASAPREATAMDPQQRQLLEASWEALERRRDRSRPRCAAASAGVFAGVMYHDYGRGLPLGDGGRGFAAAPAAQQQRRLRPRLLHARPRGPGDDASTPPAPPRWWRCTSAAAALRAGECALALAGGATVLSTPEAFIHFSPPASASPPTGAASPSPRAPTAPASSEGVGVLVLERLADAEANGHRILATIRGSAVNQDGASNGLTAPNGPSQERVIRQALANAGLEPKDVDMVEAHGTGTALGDPIEAGALLATYGQERETPLRLGSLKSNIGHAQAAAGVGGVIKAVMAMREGVMPKTLHVDAPSSKIDWSAGKVELLHEPLEWEANGRPRRAAVSSFGISAAPTPT